MRSVDVQSTGDRHPRKKTFFAWIGVSLALHALIIVSLSRITRPIDDIHERCDTGSPTPDSMRRAFVPAEMTRKATTVWKGEHGSIGEGRPDSASMPPVFEASFPPFDAQSHEITEWLALLADFPSGITGQVVEGLPAGGMDSIFAVSELLRRTLFERIVQALAQDSGRIDIGAMDWNRIVESLMQSLQERLSKSPVDALSERDMDALIAAAIQDRNTELLLERALLFSLRNEAWKRLSEDVRQAIAAALSQQSGSMCEGMPGDCRSASGSNDNGSGLLPGHGKGGEWTGFTEESLRTFESALLGQLIQKSQSNGLGNFASLFPHDELRKRLSDLARESIRRGLGGGKRAARFSQRLAMERLIDKTILRTAPQGRNARKIADNLLTVINKSLGRNILGRMGRYPSASELDRNPWYFDDLASSYWNFVYQMIRYPNCAIPNIEKYARAAQTMRNRSLPRSTDLLVGATRPKHLEELAFFTPRNIYLALAAPKQKDPRTVTPLVSPEFSTHAWGAAVRRSKPIILDGSLDEWAECGPYALWGERLGMRDIPPMLKGMNFLLTQWDNTGLYCAYRINDRRDNPVATDYFWASDALELFFDPQNAKDSTRKEGRNCQFWIWPRCGRSKGFAGQAVCPTPTSFTSQLLNDESIRVASRRTGDSYSVEAFFPASLVPTWYPLPGTIIGFNYSINNGEMVYIRWVTNKGKPDSYHPNLWGDLLLMGSDGALSLSPEEFIVPGRNVTISVVDPDMNLDALRRDLLWVVVSSGLSGDSFPLSLAETGDDSGIFTADLSTVFGVKPRLQDRLSVRPGDVLTVEYLDQHASGGRKNIQIRKSIEVGRGVFVFAD